MIEKVKKYLISVEYQWPFPPEFLCMKKEKLMTRRDKRTPFLLKFDTLDEANEYLYANEQWFVERYVIKGVSINAHLVKSS